MKKILMNIICVLFFAALAGAAGWTAFQVITLNMLTPKFLYPVLAVLLILVLLLGFFMLPKRKTGARITACILAALFIAGFIFGASAIGKVNKTVDAVTTVEKNSSVVEVYAMRISGIQTLSDAANGTFGWTDALDPDSTQKTIAEIETQLKHPLKLQSYPSVLEMVDALYNGEVDCILLNSAYLGVMEEIEGYTDFVDKTTCIFSYTVPKTEDVPKPAEPEQEVDAPEEPEPNPTFVVYVSGSDTRSKILDTSRSDVNILVTVNPETKQILLVNTPRDYFIPNPASPDGKPDKLTHCGIYGIDCSVGALSDLYDQKVDYYAQVNFTGFEALIDAIGGITVYVDQPFQSFTAGENNLNGEQALAFARDRYSFADGDNQRGKNQMKVITAVIEKATSGTTIIKNYAAILESMQGMFATSVPRELIEELVKMQLADMAHWNIKSYAVSGPLGMEQTFSAPNFYASVMFPDAAAVTHGHDLIEAVRNGEILTDEMMTAVPNP